MSGTTPAGLYRCVRSNLFALPTQTVVNGNGSAPSTITSALGSTKSFWATSSGELGTYESKVASTSNISATQTAGSVFLCCESETSIQDAGKCNGAAYFNTGQSNASYAIDKRIIINWGKNNTLFKYGGTTTVAQKDINLKWNPDILLASMYHPAEPSTVTKKTTDGTVWCDKFMTSLGTAKAATTLISSKGLNGRSKCSYILTTENSA